MPRLAGVLIHGAVTLLAGVMATAGGAALVASIFLARPQGADWGAWLPHVRTAVVGCGLSFLIAAVITMWLLPRRRELTTPSDAIDDGLPKISMAILLLIAVAATAQIPILLAWAGDTQDALQRMTGGVRDPMGLWIVPTTFAVGMLGLAALIAFIFTAMPVACYAVPPRLALRTLQVLFVLEAGLVIGSALAVASLHELLTRGFEAASASARPGELTEFTERVTRQGHYIMTLLWRFAWMLAGTVAALVSGTATRPPSPR
jgi:hypothetical protein